jgi:hypothetical protein
MKAIVTVVEKITSEAHINIPDGLALTAIKQHITDRYNSGEMLTEMNIFHVDFESISVHIGKKPQITWQPGKPGRTHGISETLAGHGS